MFTGPLSLNNVVSVNNVSYAHRRIHQSATSRRVTRSCKLPVTPSNRDRSANCASTSATASRDVPEPRSTNALRTLTWGNNLRHEFHESLHKTYQGEHLLPEPLPELLEERRSLILFQPPSIPIPRQDGQLEHEFQAGAQHVANGLLARAEQARAQDVVEHGRVAVREREDVGEGVGLAARELGEEVVEAEPDGAVVDVGRERGDKGVRDKAGMEEELVGLGERWEEGGAVPAGDAVRRGYGVRG